MSDASMQEAFEALRDLLRTRGEGLEIQTDDAGAFELRRPGHTGPASYVAGVKRGKRYTSFHLMAVYAFPHLLDDASPELRRRMQGKSCFNFTGVDDQRFEELAALLDRSLSQLRSAGML